MKRSTFTILAALALVLTVPAVAQEDLQDTRTQPDARSIAPGSGLTITGTVVEFDEKQLVLRTATGVQHIQIVPNTDKPVALEVGEGVSVDYNRTSQGVMIAQKIRPEGELGAPTTETEVRTKLETDSDRDREADIDRELHTGVEVRAEADLTTDREVETGVTASDETRWDDDALPATGSKLPLLALLGLLSVAAAIGVRFAR